MANISKITIYGNEYLVKDSTLDGKIAQEVIDRNAAIAEAIRGVTQFDYEVVSSLPASGVKGKIYLVPKTAAEQDIYDEFIWVNNAWEHIGSTAIDLSNYYTKAQVDGLLSGKQATIGDLDTIRSGAALGATALQEHQDISGKQDKSSLETDVAAKGFTKNTGTITGITMNGASKGTSGVVDLGTIITAHQDISGKADTSYVNTQLATKQDSLPAVINGKYLHANNDTGALEWSDVQGSGGGGEVIQAGYVSVAVNSWANSGKYADFAYEALIPIEGCTKAFFPEVAFSYEDSTSGNFSSMVEAIDGGVVIYAAEKPSTATMVPSIVCIHEAGFVPPGNMVNVVSSDSSAGTVSGGGFVPTGESVTVTASAISGKGVFKRWEINGSQVSTSASYTFTPTTDTTITAVFAKVVTFTLSGSYNSSYGYVTIGGTKRSSAGSYTAEVGSTVTFGVYGRNSSNPGWVKINGETVLNITNQTTGTYNWAVPDCNGVAISSTYTSSSSSRKAQMTVTTS